MLDAVKHLLGKSEKGLVSVVTLTVVTVLFGMGKIPAQMWQELVSVVFGGFIFGKTVQGVAVNVGSAKAGAQTLRDKLAENDAAADKKLAEKFGGQP